MACTASTSAQEIVQTWYSVGLNKSFQSERDVQEAIKTLYGPGATALQWEVARQRTVSGTTTHHYWPKEHRARYTPWVYTADGQTWQTEEEMRTYLVARYQSEAGCPQAAPEYNWPVDEDDAGTWHWARGTVYRYRHATQSAGCTAAGHAVSLTRTRARSCPHPRLTWNPALAACAVDIRDQQHDSFTYRIEALRPGCTVGNPCSPSSGDKHQSEHDVTLPWLTFQRDYHSISSSAKAALGPGWTHSHNLRLAIVSNVVPASLLDADGTHIEITRRNARYTLADGSGDVVTYANNTFVLMRAEQTLRFNAQGLLIERTGADGMTLSYVYNARQRLTSIVSAAGRSVALSYTDTGLIEALSSAGVELVRYAYHGDLLVSATYADGSRRTYHYEDPRWPAHLTGVTKEDGQRLAWYAYDARGRVVCSQHSPGCDQATIGTAGVRLEYLADGSTRVTDALGKRSLYQWRGGTTGVPRQLAQLTDDAGTQRVAHERSGDRRLLEAVDRRGVRNAFHYAEGQDSRTVTVTQAAGTPEARATVLTFDTASNRLRVARRGSREVRYTYNTRGQPTIIEETSPATGEHRTTQLTYCEAGDAGCGHAGQLASVSEPGGNTTQYTYHTADDPGCAEPDGHCTSRKGDLWLISNTQGQTRMVTSYDAQGRPLRIVDSKGSPTDLTYHPRGWLTRVTVRGNSPEQDRTTSFNWTPSGQLQQVTAPAGGTTTWLYNSAELLTDIVAGDGSSISYRLDAQGNPIGEDIADAQGTLRHTLSRAFDTVGRMTASFDAAGNATRYGRDAEGNLQRVFDPLGRAVHNDYDALSRVTRHTGDVDGIRAAVQLHYADDDALRHVIDPRGLVTRYVRNGLGETSGLESPDTGISRLERDAVGNITARTDARGITTRYRYDTLGRVISSVGTKPAQSRFYRYDAAMGQCGNGSHPAERLAEAMEGQGSTVYCFTRFGEVSGKIQHLDGTTLRVNYAYDKDGRLTELQLPDASRVHYRRNLQGEVTQVELQRPGMPKEIVVRDITHAPFGPVTDWIYGNGRRLQRSLDQNYRPRAVVDRRAGGLQLGMDHDAAGQLTTLRQGPNGAVLARYEHDGLGRLVGARAHTGDPRQLYQWDATGNRLSSADSDGTRAYHYADSSHHLLSDGEQTRSYDANGNTLSVGSRRFTYNDDNRMEAVYEGERRLESYTYNYLGERIRRARPGAGSVHTLYDEAGRWLGDYRSDGVAIQQAIWLDDHPVALLSMAANGLQTLAYVEPDHLGTPRVVIDSVRDVPVWRWPLEQDAFGAHAPEQDVDGDGEPFVLNLRFPGQQYSEATGLYYNYQRDLDPGVGRYVQSDPIGLRGGISTYGYVGGRPLSTIDPTGLEGVGPWTFAPGPVRQSFELPVPAARAPDYLRFQFSFYVFSMSRTYSRSGRVFLGGSVGRSYPYPAFKMQGAISAGWLHSCAVPVNEAVDNHLQGFGMSGAGAYNLLGGALNWSPNHGTSTELGVGIGGGIAPGEYAVPSDVPGMRW